MPSLRYSAAVRAILLCLLFVFPAVTLSAQRGPQLTGTVVDASGAPVAGATVAVGSATTRTAADGSFSITVPSGQVKVQASADGFAATTTTINESTGTARIVLQPAPIQDKVLVTASRGTERLATAGSETVVSAAELMNSGAGSLDDALRSTPGFSLFRRTSSRVSNPTTQGVTLRGVSGSGSSRTLVLADGVPLQPARDIATACMRHAGGHCCGRSTYGEISLAAAGAAACSYSSTRGDRRRETRETATCPTFRGRLS